MSNIISREPYDRAAKLLSSEWQQHVFNGRIVPNWLDGGNRFWYRRDVRLGREKGIEYILVDPETNASKPAFDHERLASSLGQELDRTLDRHHLKLDRLELPESCHLIRFDMDGARWECDLSSYRCTRFPVQLQPEPYELLSPDGQWGAYAEKHNLFVRHVESGEVRQLTFDGEPYYEYAGTVEEMNLNLRPEDKSFPAGLADHVAAIPQLAERYPFIDPKRVGIWGVSGGGYGSARAILTYPDVYSVAVSGAGNHDQRAYITAWGDRFQGLADQEHPDRYARQDNAQLAANLRGKLLLAHGDMDDNVHMAHTMQLVDALIRANKDFDLLIMPNVGHSIQSNRYFIRRKWDYFVKHLLGAEPPAQYETATEAQHLPAEAALSIPY
ncbi:S9 family peptidase [Paenibacillus thiaminolyticus]|uniref:Prolyl oligopeptidase family serine peptidase n=1 Tax=Paenibacillus thiaminolyticus TaxID=49283 RepID=A0A3A3GFZ4_PANTH|nr:prolyl oligopeptidase family serine peptidase [Paenibacillus thiaminolyticus]RJG22044.1 hypothetical protein DQX05_19580 [Paenibacillus thiaminolyticus]